MILEHPTDRRGALVIGAAGAGAVLLAGCAGTGSCTYGQVPAGSGQQLATLSEIPVGESITAQNSGCDTVIVTRTGDSTAVAFSAICPHRGVIVQPDGKRLHCPAHDAYFNATTGEPEEGPVDKPLKRIDVSTIDGRVTSR